MQHKIFLFLFVGLLLSVFLPTMVRAQADSCEAGCIKYGVESDQYNTCMDACITKTQKEIEPGFIASFRYNIPIGGATFFNITESNKGRILGDFFNIWYGMLMGAIGVVATFMIAWGGFQYLSSRGDSTQIGNAKNTIISAITGLILAFTSYLILSVISPNLLVFKDLKLDTVEGVASQGKDSHDNQPDSTGKYPIGADNRSTSTDSTEDSIRRQLSEKGIGVNKKACPDGMAYQQVSGSCTSVAGLQPAVINEAIRLKNACNCNVMITGGTELGHHSSDRGYLVDFNKNTGLDSHITANSTQNGTVNWDGKTYNTYKVNGHTYVDEGDHWHVMINH